MRFFLLLLLVSCAHGKKATTEYRQTINLEAKTLSSVTHSSAYDEVLINAPSFSVNQYHSGLKDLFKNDGTSLLCQPAVFANALINDVINNPEAKKLKLSGLSSDAKRIDSNALVIDLAQCMKFDQEKGASSINGANCLAHLYKSSGLEFEVVLISRYQTDYLKSLEDSVKVKNRLPTAQDIVFYLKNDYHIAGMIDFFMIDQDGKWKFTEGHVVSINGYARQKSWPDSLLYIYIADPSFYYKSSEYPRVHQFLLSKSTKSSGLPAWTSDLFLEGATMTGLYDRAFLGGLLVFKIKTK